MAGGDVGALGVDELSIDFVGKEVEVVFLHEVAQLQHLFLGIEIARGVVGVADEDGARLVGDLFLKLLHGWEFESVLNACLDGLDHGATGDGKRHVVGITGVGNDDFVSRVEACHVGKHDSLRASCGNYDFIRRDVNTILGVVANHLGAQ